MKNFIALLLTIAVLAMTACSAPAGKDPSSTTSPAIIESTPTHTGNPSAVYDALMSAAAMPLIVEVCTNKNGEPIAYYTHQDLNITLPDADVAQVITLDLLNRIDKTRSKAEEVFRSAKADYSSSKSWYPYSYATTYSPMRLDQNVLSFSVLEVSYDGSPRSSQSVYSLNYDLATGDVLNLVTIFHEENFTDAICDLVIEGLASYDQEGLFTDYKEIVRDKFYTNTTVESWYFSETGLCFYFTPYEIAPYASGVVVSEISYEALSGLLKDKYFPGEKLNYAGTLVAQAVTADNVALLDEYDQFAHITVEPGTQQFLISAQGSVSNLRVHYEADRNTGITECPILLMPGMGPGDGILLDVSLDTALENIYITYEANGVVEIFRFTK